MTEYERRGRAVEALQAGATPTEIGSRLTQSRMGLHNQGPLPERMACCT